jgi:chemotaxis protein CheD
MSEIQVRIADLAVAGGASVLVTNGIGSCIAIALYERSARVGGLAHILLPNEVLTTSHEPPGKCASSAIPAMVRRMRELKGTGEIEARLIGGASMFAPLLIPGALSLGARNIAAARAALAAADIPVVGEDVGGDHGRSVHFSLEDGSLLVRSVAKGDVRL